MISRRTRVIALLVVVVFALAGQPAVSFARPSQAEQANLAAKVGDPAAAACIQAGVVASSPPDVREPGDDTTAGAQDLTSFLRPST